MQQPRPPAPRSPQAARRSEEDTGALVCGTRALLALGGARCFYSAVAANEAGATGKASKAPIASLLAASSPSAADAAAAAAAAADVPMGEMLARKFLHLSKCDTVCQGFSKEPWEPLPEAISNEVLSKYAQRPSLRIHGVEFYRSGEPQPPMLPNYVDTFLASEHTELAPQTPVGKVQMLPKVTRRETKAAEVSQKVQALVREAMGRKLRERGGHKADLIMRTCVELVQATGDVPVSFAQRKFAKELVDLLTRRLFPYSEQVALQSDSDSVDSSGVSPMSMLSDNRSSHHKRARLQR